MAFAEAEISRPYHLVRANSGSVRFTFTVQTSQRNAVRLILSAYDDVNDDLIEIQFSCYKLLVKFMSGQTSVFRECSTQFRLVPQQPHSVWITWYNYALDIGLSDDTKPIASYSLPLDYKIGYIKYFYISSSSKRVEWQFDAPPEIPMPTKVKTVEGGALRWESLDSDGRLPPDALIGGCEGEPTYIARASHNGSVCPGKYVPSKQCAYISWGSLEHAKNDFTVLCGYNGVWTKTKGNNIPVNAFLEDTFEANRQPLYIGRARVGKDLVVGKVSPMYSTCYLPVGGKEVEVGTYEILIVPDGVTQLKRMNLDDTFS